MSPGVPIKSLPLSCRLLYPAPYDARLVDDDARRDAPQMRRAARLAQKFAERPEEFGIQRRVRRGRGQRERRSTRRIVGVRSLFARRALIGSRATRRERSGGEALSAALLRSPVSESRPRHYVMPHRGLELPDELERRSMQRRRSIADLLARFDVRSYTSTSTSVPVTRTP